MPIGSCNGGAVVIPDRVLVRVWRYVVRGHPTSCWLWLASTGSHGYGQIGWGGAPNRGGTTAHRAVWTAVHGQIPDGLTVDHAPRSPRCDPRCVNPSHLRLLTNVDNARDNRQAQRGLGLRSYKEALP